MDYIGNYNSDSDSDNATETPHKTLPPLPNSIIERFQKAPSSSMSFRYHGLKSIPPGYQNSYTCAEFLPSVDAIMRLKEIIASANMVCKYTKLRPPRFIPVYQNALNITNSLHLSLTDNFFLSREQKDQFKTRLASKLSDLKIPKRTLTFSKVIAVPNSTATNSFLALKLSKESNESVKPLYDFMHEVIQDITGGDRLIVGPELSRDQLHVSIAQCEHDFKYDLDQLNEVVELLHDLEIDEGLEFQFDSLKVLDGQKRWTVNLNRNE
jgi:hypothetical protein